MDLEEIIKYRTPVTIAPGGLSMHPFIRPFDRVTIVPGNGEIGIGDVVLIQGESERWLIHRVIGRRRDCGRWITRGDSLLHPDPPAVPARVWGTVTGVERRGQKKEYQLRSPVRRRLGRLIAACSRLETRLAAGGPGRRLEAAGLFPAKAVKFPRWIITRIFFP